MLQKPMSISQSSIDPPHVTSSPCTYEIESDDSAKTFGRRANESDGKEDSDNRCSSSGSDNHISEPGNEKNCVPHFMRDLPRNRAVLEETLCDANNVCRLLQWDCGCGKFCMQKLRLAFESAYGDEYFAIPKILELRRIRFDTPYRREKIWIWDLIAACHKYNPAGGNASHKFDWVLRFSGAASTGASLSVSLCRRAFFYCHGLHDPKRSTRIRGILAKIRSLATRPVPARTCPQVTSRSATAKAWIWKYISLHGQPVPAATGM